MTTGILLSFGRQGGNNNNILFLKDRHGVLVVMMMMLLCPPIYCCLCSIVYRIFSSHSHARRVMRFFGFLAAVSRLATHTTSQAVL